MIPVIFYNFAKRRNSTARPDGNGLFSAQCSLKEGTSVAAPTLQIANYQLGTPTLGNYAFIGTFSRYYYVRDWAYIDGLWEVSMEVDVLATYRVQIGNSSAYVARASADYDGTIIDGMYPAKASKAYTFKTWDPWPSFEGGSYVVGIINGDAGNLGGVSYYVFSQANFAAFKNFLMGDYDWTGIEDSNPDLGENLYKSLFNPFQYISTINWVPVGVASIAGGAVSNLTLGWWEVTGISCYYLNSTGYNYSHSFEVDAHPQTGARGAFLCCAPYSQYRFVIPPFGEFTLDANMIGSSFLQGDGGLYAQLTCSIHLDLITGSGEMHLNCLSGTLVRAQAVMGVPVHIAQINSDGWGQIRNIAETASNGIGNLLSGNLGGAISGAVTGILNGIEYNIPHVQEKGSNGSFCAYHYPARIEQIWSIAVDDALADKGRPLCKEVTLSTLAGGYVQTVGAHVDIAGFADEISQINEMLDAGIYLILAAG